MSTENNKYPAPQGEFDDNQYSLTDMYDPRSKYTVEQKIAAVMAYITTGTSKQAAKQPTCEVPATTIRWWKSAAHWWNDAVAVCRERKNDELDAVCSQIIDNAIGKLQERIDKGDQVITKNGDLIYKEISGRDLAWIFGVVYDKRNLSRGAPTSISSKKDSKEMLDVMQKRLEDFSKEMKARENKKIVSEQ